MTGQGPRFDVQPFLSQDEGQHFDRKSSPRVRKVVHSV
jgi:hypothetical protein